MRKRSPDPVEVVKEAVRKGKRATRAKSATVPLANGAAVEAQIGNGGHTATINLVTGQTGTRVATCRVHDGRCLREAGEVIRERTAC